MTQAYSNPAREAEPHALPDVEVFYVSQQDFIRAGPDSCHRERLDRERETTPNNFQAAGFLQGWYWWACFPGCLPDSDPYGPYDTEEQALEAAQQTD